MTPDDNIYFEQVGSYESRSASALSAIIRSVFIDPIGGVQSIQGIPGKWKTVGDGIHTMGQSLSDANKTLMTKWDGAAQGAFFDAMNRVMRFTSAMHGAALAGPSSSFNRSASSLSDYLTSTRSVIQGSEYIELAFDKKTSDIGRMSPGDAWNYLRLHSKAAFDEANNGHVFTASNRQSSDDVLFKTSNDELLATWKAKLILERNFCTVASWILVSVDRAYRAIKQGLPTPPAPEILYTNEGGLNQPWMGGANGWPSGPGTVPETPAPPNLDDPALQQALQDKQLENMSPFSPVDGAPMGGGGGSGIPTAPAGYTPPNLPGGGGTPTFPGGGVPTLPGGGAPIVPGPGHTPAPFVPGVYPVGRVPGVTSVRPGGIGGRGLGRIGSGGIGSGGIGNGGIGGGAPGVGGALGRGAAAGTAAGAGMFPPMYPPMGMGAGQDKERRTGLVEDENFWRVDVDCAPAIVTGQQQD